jgi:transmembrane sensor
MSSTQPPPSFRTEAAGRKPGNAETTASLWLVRQRNGLDEEEKQELAAWLEDPVHAAAYARISDMAGVMERARAQGAGSAILAELAARNRQRRSRRRMAAGAVAAALVVFAATWGALTLQSQARRATASAVAQAFEPIRRLPDGSLVELNRQAEIAVRFDAAVRHVELVRGEALFRVEKDAARPFVVRAGGVEVRAVGTAFNVRLSSVGVEVLVTEGRVGVDDVARRKSLLPVTPTGDDRLLVAGERAVVAHTATGAAGAAVEVAQVSAAEIKAHLAWRVPRLEFEGVELAQAVAQMNQQNRVQISLEDEELAQLRISGTFLTDEPQTFARLVAATFGVEARPRGEAEIVLRKAR